MGNTMGDCGCGDSTKDVIKSGPNYNPTKERGGGVEFDLPSTKVDDDAAAVQTGPDKSILALIKTIEEMKESHRQRSSEVPSQSKQEKPRTAEGHPSSSVS